MYMTFRNNIFTEEIGMQNLLKELEKKLLEQFGHVNRMERPRIPRKAFAFKFKERHL